MRIHIHPPSTPFFSMAVQKRGRVMPGMAEEVTVTFSGDELRFTDAIRVHLPGGQNLRVPLYAFPAVGPLSFPRRVDFGKVQLGAVARKALPLRSAVPVEFDSGADARVGADAGRAALRRRPRQRRVLDRAAVHAEPLRHRRRPLPPLALLLAFEPIEVEVVGSALGPTEVRKEHLNELLAQREADLAARAAAEKPSSPTPSRRRARLPAPPPLPAAGPRPLAPSPLAPSTLTPLRAAL